MTSQDDLGMLWYGVPGISYNNADPAEVMLNAGAAAPLLSDQPRGLLTQQDPQLMQNINHCQSYAYNDPNALGPVHQNQIYYDPNSVECLNQADSIYETYEGYDEEPCSTNAMETGGLHCINGQMQDGSTEDEDSPQPKINKKPKVHQNPALKLKTPIAYQRDTDPNAIPIMKEGMAICDRCGAIGVKHAFYGKDRKYCSLGCARGPNVNSLLRKSSFDESRLLDGEQVKIETVDIKESPPVDISVTGCLEHGSNNTPPDDAVVPQFPLLDNNSTGLNIDSQSSSYSMETDLMQSYKWETFYLSSDNFRAAPVQSFQHVPMSECWQLIGKGMKVEVSCKEEDSSDDVFWVATVIGLSGYKAKLRFEGCLKDESNDFWVDICSNEVHPVGWCATQGKALIPPKPIRHKYSDWKEFLMMRLTGAQTLPTNFHTKILDSQKSRFRCGLELEVVDKNRIAQMRVASVMMIVGKRLHLKYHGAPQDDSGFWCHEDSPLIHPVGWSREIGHEIVASQSYHEKCMQNSYSVDDAPSHLFIHPETNFIVSGDHIKTRMKLEALDPLNLSRICVASIMKVLANSYLMIKIDSYEADSSGSDWFCYHSSSPYIFPCGFCDSNNIHLSPPKGCLEFNWSNYLQQTQSIAMPSSAFERKVPKLDFVKGMSLEAVDLMDPRLVCVAQVEDIKGRLLKIHFDGWESEFDQWVDCESPDIYPVGWCDLVNYSLEAPREGMPPIVTKRKVRGSKKWKFFRRGVENASPTNSSLLHKKVSKGRGRGGFGGSSLNITSSAQNITNDNIVQSDEYSQPVLKGRRGRPRKIPLQSVNHPPRTDYKRHPRSAKTKSQFQNCDDGDVSDETSSSVVSLAESEVSNDFWEDDGLFKANNPQDINISVPQNFNKDKLKCELPNNPETVFDSISSFGVSLGNILLEEDECKQPMKNGTTDNNPSDFDNLITNDNVTASFVEEVVDLHVMEDCNIRPNLPRIIDIPVGSKSINVEPNIWSAEDVANFLINNDCGAYSQNFISEKVDGPAFLALTQNDLMSLTKMKVGPCIKIKALIQQVIAIVNPAQARYQATLLKKKTFS